MNSPCRSAVWMCLARLIISGDFDGQVHTTIGLLDPSAATFLRATAMLTALVRYEDQLILLQTGCNLPYIPAPSRSEAFTEQGFRLDESPEGVALKQTEETRGQPNHAY